MFSIVCCVRLDSSFLRTLFVSLLGSTAFSFPFVIGASAVDDLPSGGSVIAGQATIGGAGNNMLITQSSENAIINWDGFSIGAGNNVAFQNGSGATLNRVIGTDISTINGGLTATGSLFLINQNGVIIGEHGVIETGGSFVASTLDVANEDFLNGGDLRFFGDLKASVINLGKVFSLGGDVSFIARAIGNEGVISAPNGTASLVAGREVLMRDSALDDGKFVVKLGDATSSVTEAGMIAAASVELRANGGNVYALAGNKGGAINATGVTSSGGRIFLTAPGGKVRVTKQIKATRNTGAGGDIFINADIVSIASLLDVSSTTRQAGNIDIGASGSITLEGATLDASGYAGGGTIRVGGEYQGGKSLTKDEVQNAQTLLIDELSALKADGTGDNADGGTVIVWADDDTTFNGTISATAAGIGHGGFVETSAAHLHIGDSARVTTLSEGGVSGTWLLDPADFIVAVTLADGDMTGQTLSDNLANNGTVTILNSEGDTGTNGDILINDDVSWSTNSKLELSADRNVEINANVTATGESASLDIDHNGAYIFGAGGKVTLSGDSASLEVNGDTYELIHDVNQLQAINGDLDGLYALAEDIDASATADWSGGFNPIGIDVTGAEFTGNFNGQGHVITDLFIDRSTTDNVGLFGYTNYADIANVGTIGGSVTGRDYVGGLVGYQFHGNLSNVYATGDVTGDDYVGGLVGTQARSALSNAYATGAVSGDVHVGGLIGYLFNTETSNVYATGAVSGTEKLGGLIGFKQFGNLTNAYATGAVTGTGDQVGGLIGRHESGTNRNTYATGKVAGTGDAVGGLAGYINMFGKYYNSFWDKDTTNQAKAVGDGSQSGTNGLTTAEAFDVSKYTEKNWTVGTPVGNDVPAGDWLMIDGETRPFLAFEYSTKIANAHQLQLMAFDLDADYTLAANIDASHTDGIANPSQMWGASGFVPIGDGTSSFDGNFDGQGHTVSDLVIDRASADYVGLFGRTDNANIANVGMIGGVATGFNYVGGLVGQLNNTSVENVFATGAVNSGNFHAGGLVGNVIHSTINTAYATGAVEGPNLTGGLVGMLEQNSSIENAYATGNVNGETDAGGLVGAAVDSSITNTYATGEMTIGPDADHDGGALIGHSIDTIVVRSFWDKNKNPGFNGIGKLEDGSVDVEGLTTVEFQNMEGFMSAATDWDFQNVWAPPSAGYYPELYALSQVVWVQADDASRTYGDGNPALTANGYGGPDVYIFGPAGDVLDFASVLSTTADTGSDVGDYVITSNDTAISFLGETYRVVATAGELNVTPADLKVTADNDGKTYGETINFAGTEFTSSGLVNGDLIDLVDLSSTGADASASVVGSPHAIVASNASGVGFDANNYTITYVDGQLTVTPADLTVTADGADKVYGDTINFAGTEFTSSGLVNGDLIDLVDLSSTGADASASVVGSPYTIVASGALGAGFDANNYDITYVDGELVVTPAALTVTANDDSKVFDGQPYAGGNGVSYAGLVNGEGAGVLNGVLGYGGTSQGAVDPQRYSITPEGLASGNYTITFVDGTLTLFPVPGMQTDVSSFADDGNGFGQNIVCADEELLNCDLVEAKF